MWHKKIWTVIALCALLLACVISGGVTASAETKQARLINLERQKDLAVMFTFDKEVVDIVFLSPSGAEKRASDPDVDYAGGDLWSTYRISDAEAGTWLVQYDLKTNSEIGYSVIEDDYGLWIQYVEAEGADGEKFIAGGGSTGGSEEKNAVSGDRASVKFEADCESETLNYNYTLFAVDTADAGAGVKLASGTARSGEEKSINVRLTSLSSGNYVLKLEVYHRTGAAELFDSVTTEPFDYKNPNEPGGIENFALRIDNGNLTCAVDWKAFARWSYDAYKLSVSGDGQQLYSGELAKSVTAAGVVFPEGTKQLTVELFYQDNGIWSKPLSKTVELDREYLHLVTGEVTGAGQAVVAYHVAAERSMNVSVNGVEGNFLLRGEGELSFDLQQGNNSFHAEFESEPLIFLVIDEEVYFDAYPPEIKLYENLDGKTFYDESVDILGRMTGGNRLLVNGSETALGENGEFCINIHLASGENVLSIEAQDVNGNSALINLTLYKASKALGADSAGGGTMRFLPLLAALTVSLVVIILSAIFMKKTKRQTARAFRLWKWILWDSALAAVDAACIFGFIVYYRRVNSMAFLELAEKSVSEAVRYLWIEKALGIAALGMFVLLVFCVIITIFKKKRGEKRRAESAAPVEER